MFPGGFSAGDEPEGSAKFFATVFRNAVMKEELEKLEEEKQEGVESFGMYQNLVRAFRTEKSDQEVEAEKR